MKRPRWWMPDLHDVHIYGGGLLAGIGLWLIAPALGLIGFGLVLVVLGILGLRG